MWYAASKRYFRRRIVLVLIFALFFTYFLMYLLGNGGSLSLDNDDYIVRRERPLIWRTLQEHVLTDNSNQTNDSSQNCRNTVQGKLLITDERGYVCKRHQVLANGCCNVELDDIQYYSCDTCAESNCCAIYEYCVSCCLHPSKKPLLEQVLEKITGRQAFAYAVVEDHFELCLVKCRTNSHSVQHENRYRDPTVKYCYGQTEAHESQRSVSFCWTSLLLLSAALISVVFIQ